MKGADESRRVNVVRTTLEAIYAFSHFLAPTIPLAAQAIFDKLNSPPIATKNLRKDFYNLRPGTSVSLGAILFQKILDDTSNAEGSGSVVLPGEASSVKPAKGPGDKKGNKNSKVTSVEEENPNQSDFSKIELRVARINRVWNHETAERFFLLSIYIDIYESLFLFCVVCFVKKSILVTQLTGFDRWSLACVRFIH